MGWRHGARGGVVLRGPLVPGQVLEFWGRVDSHEPPAGNGGPAVAGSVSVTMTQVSEDGGEGPVVRRP
jgi:hypothetical protein